MTSSNRIQNQISTALLATGAAVLFFASVALIRVRCMGIPWKRYFRTTFNPLILLISWPYHLSTFILWAYGKCGVKNESGAADKDLELGNIDPRRPAGERNGRSRALCPYKKVYKNADDVHVEDLLAEAALEGYTITFSQERKDGAACIVANYIPLESIASWDVASDATRPSDLHPAGPPPTRLYSRYAYDPPYISDRNVVGGENLSYFTTDPSQPPFDPSFNRRRPRPEFEGNRIVRRAVPVNGGSEGPRRDGVLDVDLDTESETPPAAQDGSNSGSEISLSDQMRVESPLHRSTVRCVSLDHPKPRRPFEVATVLVVDRVLSKDPTPVKRWDSLDLAEFSRDVDFELYTSESESEGDEGSSEDEAGSSSEEEGNLLDEYAE
ncbi:hypothetical protein P154DRAFT_605107 [Amniculicola lignicola CBS 123094]|uniref:Uncharacterized protein n=1 Tax=Amniculicola lignicola CBS 123094 TaxID=1392246 RepID=A0A6A5W7T9_9PLEO|nr:hypothetical protein P154DRAFT_605107 [Amniculicola lignicola CBS 123094]